MKTEIVSIGTELTSGKNLDTNSQWLSVELGKIGIPVHFHSTVGDDLDDNLLVLRSAIDRSDLVVISGGLGPTQDDLTREAIARVAGVPLELDPISLEAIRGMFARRHRAMPERNRVQALFPAGSEPIPNPHGTAPGIWMRIPKSPESSVQSRVPEEGRESRAESREPQKAERARTDSANLESPAPRQAVPSGRRFPAAAAELATLDSGLSTLVIAMPGVPSEMVRMFAEQVRPRLPQVFGPRGVIVHRKINSFGAGESDVEARLADLTARGHRPEVGITVHDATISLRIIAAAGSQEEAQAEIEPTARTIYERLGTLVFGEGDEELEHVVARLLAESQLTVSTAEGCTGGTLAERLASVPDASAWYRGGVVAYANRWTEEALGVPRDLIERHGAVSGEVAQAMAVACRRRTRSDLAVATVGVAGPDAISAEKPAGTVWVAVVSPTGADTQRFQVLGDRGTVMSRAAKHALNQLRLWLLEHAASRPASGPASRQAPTPIVRRFG